MKFSIITAVYNNRTFVETALLSVINQSHPDIEYIVIDGNSSDGTVEILKDYYGQGKITHFVSEPDNGIYDALNKGLTRATGDVVGFLHSDDFYVKNNILADLNDIFENNLTDAVYGDLTYVSKKNPEIIVRYWKSCMFSPSLLSKGWMPPHPTFFVKREVYLRAGFFDTGFRIAADYELMLRFLGKYKISAKYFPETIVAMRVGGASNRSIKNLFVKSYEDFIAIKRYNTGNFVTLLLKNMSKVSQFFKQ